MKRMLSFAPLLALALAATWIGVAQAALPADGAGSGAGDKGTQLGKRQHKPMDAPPADATARCNDGSYSTDIDRKTACRANGGIAKWLKR